MLCSSLLVPGRAGTTWIADHSALRQYPKTVLALLAKAAEDRARRYIVSSDDDGQFARDPKAYAPQVERLLELAVAADLDG